MAGLSKAIIRKYGISSRAWREQRKLNKKKKGGATVARKKARRKARKAPARRRIRASARRIGTVARRRSRNVMSATTRAAMRTGIGVAGAVGSAAIVNMLPIKTPQAKALTQLGIGLGAIALVPKRRAAMRIAAAGTSLAGALALVKTSGVPLPLLAGYGPRMGLNYYPNMSGRIGRSYRPYRAAERGVAAKTKNVPMLGVNKHYGGMAGTGYGSRFVSQANL